MKIVRIVSFVLLSLIIYGCGVINTPSSSDDDVFVRNNRLQKPQQLPDVSLSIIKTAEWQSLEGFLYSGGSWVSSRTSAHSAILIRHPSGTLMFDTGLGRNVDEQFLANIPFWLKPFMAYENHFPAKFRLENETDGNSVKIIILSHLHWDHVSGVEDFNDVEIWTTEEEYEWVMKHNTLESSFIKSQYSRDDVTWRFIQFLSGPYENFGQSLDIFQDGSLVLVPLPGHTPGAIGMFVNFKSGKRLFFTGDTTWTMEGFQKPAHKFWASSLLADHDQKTTERSILRVHELMRKYPELIVVPSHDDKLQKTIGFFPEFID